MARRIAVDPTDLASVWQVMNIAVAIGRVLRPESDAQATIARASILSQLQARNGAPAQPSKATFQTAAIVPIERRIETPADLDLLARFFSD